MATTLFKLVMSATTDTTTTTNPAVQEYFYKVAATELVGDTLTIPSTLFTDSSGAAVTGNLTLATANNGYYSLFVNGSLQQTSLFTIGASGSEVVITQSSTVPISAPITLEVSNFAPNSTSTTTVTA